MYELPKIDLGKDEAEQEEYLRQYFLKTSQYNNALTGNKTVIIGRKGSGKSAIYKLLQEELADQGNVVISITPDQYSWSALKDYREKGILPEQAHTNAWKMTLLSAVIWKLNETNHLSKTSPLIKYYKYMKDSYSPTENHWLLNIIEKGKKLLSGISTEFISFNYTSSIATPLKVIEEIKSLLNKEWPDNIHCRIIIDRLDDSWDASDESKHLIIGLLKAANEINYTFIKNITTTIFIRSDIYSFLFFDDQDKIRQNEEYLIWKVDDLKAVISERIRFSLNISDGTNKIWNNLFSRKLYRQSAKPEKYIIDRTFKRPRDIISFVRFALENAIKHNHKKIEPIDTRYAEEEKYSESKFKDLVIEYQKQYSYVRQLIESFSGSLHKQYKEELLSKLKTFCMDNSIKIDIHQLLRILFQIGFLGVKRKGRAGVKQRGGTQFYYYYDDQSINPLSYNDYYIHPAFRHYLNISEKREKTKSSK